jgi:RNA polymerase sigma-70 factor (ECF subfamily)
MTPERDHDDRAELLALIRRAQTGDLRAQSEIICRYQVRAAGLVRPIVRNAETVKDVVQSVMLKMVKRLPTLRDPETFESWLFTMARNTAVDEIRRARCRPVTLSDDFLHVELTDPCPDDRSGEVLEAVDLVTARWSRLNRRILDCVLAGLSYQAVAEREGLSIGAVKLRVHRLRQVLRDKVGRALLDVRRTPSRAGAAYL